MFGRLFGKGAPGAGDHERLLDASHWPRDKAVLALFLAASASDRDVALEEEVEIVALVNRARTTRELSQEMPTQHFDALVGELLRALFDSATSADEVIERACTGLGRSGAVAESVYAHCVDIVFADRRVRPLENMFLSRLRHRLGVKGVQADRIHEILGAKNRH